MNEQPTQGKKRIELLDVYRGFAILGIFVVNIVIMNSTFLHQDEFARQWTSWIDVVSKKILQLFFYTKFFPIFSLLFGLGISLQALKLFREKTSSPAFFFRRMFILFMFGIAHILLLWSGDVLNVYAILGLFATTMVKRSNKLILALAVFFLLFPFYDQLFAYFFQLIHFQPESFLSHHTGATVNEIIKNGTYWEGLRLRILEYLSNTTMLFGFLTPVAASMFLLGLYLGKNNILSAPDQFIQRIKSPMLIVALITNIYRVFFLFVLIDLDVFQIDVYREIFIKLMILCDTIMGLFYLWIIGWFWFNTKWKAVLAPLKYAGRMALTNYIMHSVIGLFLFSSVGLSLYETMRPSETILTAVTVFCIQVVLSKIWLTYFLYGPLEWIWRCLSYQTLLPIRR